MNNETKALLLTDVVDSTKLSETLGDAAMADVWAAHDRVARDLLPGFGGLEIDKTDGMLLLFERVGDAVRYALAYHAGLAAVGAAFKPALPWPLRARAGLHLGPVILRRNTPQDVARGAKPLEVDGLAKPTAARVMSLARGGQTLLTPQALAALDAEAAQDGQHRHGPALLRQSHGHWVLKGVSEPVELTEVGADATAFAAPPDGDKAWRVVRSGGRWLPVREVPGNLPAQASSFVGRGRELDEIKALVAASPLVSVLGMGGLGKTRLALQAAAELRADFPDGTWFVDLAPLRDPALVASETAQVLGLREEPGRPLQQTLCSHLAGQRSLLLFDNCEHLLPAVAPLVHALVRAAPGVRVVASSREALRLPGEQIYPIHPLPLPARGAGLAALQASPAVQLFVQRARAQNPGWMLDETQAGAVAELVHRLEGIPLALELAAARVRALPVAEINQRLHDRYRLLTGGSRVAQQRQQTLRALVDWSHELLQPEEQVLFRRLAVFAGGFDLDAAEAVCADAALDMLDVVDLLGSLVDKSLLLHEQAPGGAARYRMLETLREYGRARLTAADDSAATAERHAAHFFALAKQVRDGLRGAEQGRWVQRMETDLDNLRAALALPLAGGADPFMAVKIAVAMQNFWILRGYATEGRAAVRAALALPAVQATPMAQAWALYVGACLAAAQADHAEARRMLEDCLALRRALGNPVEIAATLSTLAMARFQGGDLAGAVAGETEALEIFRAQGDRQGEAIGQLHLAQFALFAGDDTGTAGHVEQGLALARAIGHREIEGDCTWIGGQLACEQGDACAALDGFTRALQIASESGNRRGEAAARWGLGRVQLHRAEVAEAWPHLLAALGAFREFEMREEALGCLEDFVAAAQLAHRAHHATALAGAVTPLRQRMGLRRSPRQEARWAAIVAAGKHDAADAGATEAAGTDPGWTLDEAVACALRLPEGG